MDLTRHARQATRLIALALGIAALSCAAGATPLTDAASAATTLPKWQVTLNTSPAQTRVNQTIVYSGTVKTAAGRAGGGTVTLQKRPASGGAWTNWKTASLKANGGYSLSVKMSNAQVSQVRARKAGTTANATGFSATRKITVTSLPTWRVSLNVSPSQTTVNRTIAYSGTVKTATGRAGSGSVVLQRRPSSGGVWKAWRTVSLKSNGSYALNVKMTVSQISQVRARKAPTSANAAGLSPVRAITVTAPSSSTSTVTTTSTAAAPSVPAGYTLIADQTIRDFSTDSLSNRYYYNCTFTGGSATQAVLTIRGTAHNLIFDRCTITSGGGWNGISINDSYGRVHDITFTRCQIKTQGRMGFECTSRPTSASVQYRRVNLIGCSFEPQGNQAVSYDGGPQAGGCTINGNVIRGAGNDPAQPFGAALEINGPSDMTVRNNVIYQCRDSVLNLQRHVTAPSGWVFTDNVFDTSTRLQATPMDAYSQVVLAFNVYGGTFARNTVISSAPGGGVAYLSNCHDMDWRTSTWRDATGRAGYATPTQVKGCSGNRF
jgi:hypothetical protein